MTVDKLALFDDKIEIVDPFDGNAINGRIDISQRADVRLINGGVILDTDSSQLQALEDPLHRFCYVIMNSGTMIWRWRVDR